MCRKLLPLLALLAPLIVVPGIYDPANLSQSAFIQIASTGLLALWLREGAPGFRSPRHALDAPLALFLAWSGASLLWSTNRYEALLVVAQWACCGIVYVVASRSRLRDQDVHRLLSALVAAAVLASLLGLSQRLLGFDRIPQAFPPAATFANKNLAAQFLVMVLPIAIALFLIARGRAAEWSFALASGIITAFLFHTAARAAWLAASASLGAATALSLRRHPHLARQLREGAKPYAAAAALALTLGLVAARPPSGPSLGDVPRLVRGALEGAYMAGGQGAPAVAGRSTDPPESRSVTLRLHVWSDSIAMIRENALLGVGAGNFKVHYPRFALEGSAGIVDPRFQPEAVHNDYLQVACELGCVGAVLLLWLLWRSFTTWRDELHSEPREEGRILAVGLGAGLLACCVDGLFSFPLERAVPPLVAALYAAILAGWRREPSPAAALEPRLLQRAQVVASAGLLLAVVWGAAQLAADRHVLRMLEAEERRDWNSVVREGERAAAFNPFRTAPLFVVATAQLRLGAAAAAAATLERVLDGYPFYLNAVGNLGLAYLEIGRPERAKACFERVLASRPSDPLGHYGLGRVLEKTGQSWPALAELRRAAVLDPAQPWMSYEHGRLAVALGERAEGVAAFKQTLARSPDWADAHARLGLILLEEPGSESEAREHLEAALRLDPQRADAAKIRALLARADTGRRAR